MSSAVRHVTIDCHDPYRLAGFWADVLGGKIHEDDQPGDAEVLIIGPEPPLLFIQVPEGKTIKNRVHLDIQPQDRTRDAEVERLVKRGATMVGDHRTENGMGWATLADPEGNEFCVERSRAERASRSGRHPGADVAEQRRPGAAVQLAPRGPVGTAPGVAGRPACAAPAGAAQAGQTTPSRLPRARDHPLAGAARGWPGLPAARPAGGLV